MHPLNPPDTFLNSYLKEKTWESGPIVSLEQLKQRFFEEVERVPILEIQKAIKNLRKRVKHCCYMAGGHFEKSLKSKRLSKLLRN